MKKVWNARMLFDSGSDWICSKEGFLGERPRKTCRLSVGDTFRTERPSCPEHGRDSLRMERILRLRAAIADGTYSVSSADLAQKLMSHMLA